jgi:hypothetical protein
LRASEQGRIDRMQLTGAKVPQELIDLCERRFLIDIVDAIVHGQRFTRVRMKE